MYTVLIFAIIGLVIGLIKGYDKDEDSLVFKIMMMLANGFMGITLACMVGVWVAKALPMDLYNEGNFYHIETFYENDSSFYIGSGKTKKDTKYLFFINDNNQKKIMIIDSTDTKIMFDSGRPKLLVHKLIRTDSWINNFATDSDEDKKSYVIKIPQHTIKTDFISEN